MKRKKDVIDKRGVSLSEHRRAVRKYGNRYYPARGHDGQILVIFLKKKAAL